MRLEEVASGIRAILARKLVEEHGFGKKRVSEALGLSQPAISLYLSGRRAAASARKILENPAASRYIDELLEKVLSRGVLREGELYDAAFSVWRLLEAERGEMLVEPSSISAETAKLLDSLRKRVQAEQESAEEFMRIAVSLRGDLARMIFRLIASDCIRHADVIMALIASIERGETLEISRLKKIDLERLLRKEEETHIGSLDELKKLLPGGLGYILVELIRDDERKHSKIIRGIMKLIGES